MITIENLTARQRSLMDIMWSMENMEQVRRFIATLPKQDAQDCISLVWMAKWEDLEQNGGLRTTRQIAQDLIQRVRQ